MPVVLSLLIGLPLVSLTAVVTFILKVVELLKLPGSKVNVMLSELDGCEAIWTQLFVAKLLEDTRIDPEEHDESEVFTSKVLLSIASEKVTLMSVLQYSVLALSAALYGPLLFTLIVVELTVGGTVSVIV